MEEGKIGKAEVFTSMVPPPSPRVCTHPPVRTHSVQCSSLHMYIHHLVQRHRTTQVKSLVDAKCRCYFQGGIGRHARTLSAACLAQPPNVSSRSHRMSRSLIGALAPKPNDLLPRATDSRTWQGRGDSVLAGSVTTSSFLCGASACAWLVWPCTPTACRWGPKAVWVAC